MFELAGDFISSLQISFEGGFLDTPLVGSLTGVHINRHQSFGLVDNQGPARFQPDPRVMHSSQHLFDIVMLKQVFVGIFATFILLDLFDVGRREVFHVGACSLIAVFALDDNLADIRGIIIAHCPFDEVCPFIDKGGGRGFQRQFAHIFPFPQQVIIVASKLSFGASASSRPGDDRHAVRDSEAINNRLQLLAVFGIADFTANPAAVVGVRHQH